MIETNYVTIYMEIDYIFFVIKGQIPVMDYIFNTIILYFIVQFMFYVYFTAYHACVNLSHHLWVAWDV